MPPASPSTSAARTELLTERYGSLLVLDDLDLPVAAEEVPGFLGPHGAGRSTTIHCRAGPARPSAVRAWIPGCG